MTDYKQMYDKWVADMQAKGCGGIVELFSDYQNDCTNQHHETTSQDKQKSVNTTSKNERPAVGIGGPSSLIEVMS